MALAAVGEQMTWERSAPLMAGELGLGASEVTDLRIAERRWQQKMGRLCS